MMDSRAFYSTQYSILFPSGWTEAGAYIAECMFYRVFKWQSRNYYYYYYYYYYSFVTPSGNIITHIYADKNKTQPIAY